MIAQANQAVDLYDDSIEKSCDTKYATILNSRGITNRPTVEAFSSTGMLKSMTNKTHALRVWAYYHFLPCMDPFLYQDFVSSAAFDDPAVFQKYKALCHPEGQIKKTLMEDVLSQGSVTKDLLVRIGLELHVLNDTWAHRDFAGINDETLNDVSTTTYDKTEKLGAFDFGSSYVPLAKLSLGHGRIGGWCDDGFRVFAYIPAWRTRSEAKKTFYIRDNTDGFEKAFGEMYDLLCRFRSGKSLNDRIDQIDAEIYAAICPVVKKIIAFDPGKKSDNAPFETTEACWELFARKIRNITDRNVFADPTAGANATDPFIPSQNDVEMIAMFEISSWTEATDNSAIIAFIKAQNDHFNLVDPLCSEILKSA